MKTKLHFCAGCLQNSDPLKNDWDFKYRFTWLTIIVTNPKCQIKQQSRVYNWRPVNGFLCIFLFKTWTKTTRINTIRTIAKLFHFRVILQKKKDMNSQDSAMINLMHINHSFYVNMLTNTWTAKLFYPNSSDTDHFSRGLEFRVFKKLRPRKLRPLEKWSASDELRLKKVSGSCISWQKTVTIIHVELRLKSQ